MKVIDLFSGPGGLGEGFSSLNGGASFNIAVSAEMEASAHKTLTLRAFFRLAQRLGDKRAIDSYYSFCNFEDAEHPSLAHAKLWALASDEARQLELGNPASDDVLNQIIKSKRLGGDDTVLIGGPPCQAYSHAGRARNKGKTDYVAAKDHRHYLYREYLKVLAKTKPAIFVMENVKGILSSSPGGTPIFHEILKDLTDPVRAIEDKDGPIYAIHSLTTSTCFEKGMSPDEIDPRDFIIQAEHYGIPQERHRVILLGVRKDRKFSVTALQKSSPVSVRTAIGRLPRLRSQISPLRDDSPSNWVNAVASNGRRLAKDALKADMNLLGHRLFEVSNNLDSRLNNGALRVPVTKKTTDDRKPSAFMESIGDSNLLVWLNHQARSHMPSDLGRYVYASSFCEVYSRYGRGRGYR